MKELEKFETFEELKATSDERKMEMPNHENLKDFLEQLRNAHVKTNSNRKHG